MYDISIYLDNYSAIIKFCLILLLISIFLFLIKFIFLKKWKNKKVTDLIIFLLLASLLLSLIYFPTYYAITKDVKTQNLINDTGIFNNYNHKGYAVYIDGNKYCFIKFDDPLINRDNFGKTFEFEYYENSKSIYSIKLVEDAVTTEYTLGNSITYDLTLYDSKYKPIGITLFGLFFLFFILNVIFFIKEKKKSNSALKLSLTILTTILIIMFCTFGKALSFLSTKQELDYKLIEKSGVYEQSYPLLNMVIIDGNKYYIYDYNDPIINKDNIGKEVKVIYYLNSKCIYAIEEYDETEN